MPDNTLAIRVSAIDEASPVFDKVGHNAKKLKNDAEGAGLEGGESILPCGRRLISLA